VITAVLMQAGFKLMLALAAIVMVWFTLRFLDDKIENDSFADTLKTASPPEKMLYFSARFIGICILVGMVIS
jgi:hypothetical protein